MRTSPPVLAPIFRSDGQARLLAQLFMSTKPEHNVKELGERAGLAYASAYREVRRLLDAGILAEHRVGNVRLVRPNEASPLAGPLRQLLVVSAGPVPLLAEALQAIAGIQCAFIFGSFAARALGEPGDPPVDVDLMVVGDPDAARVYHACRSVSDEVNRPVNPTIMTPTEWAAESAFVEHVREHSALPVVGRLPWS